MAVRVSLSRAHAGKHVSMMLMIMMVLIKVLVIDVREV